MSHLFPELLPLILNFTLSMPLGLSAMQLLSIDLFTELTPAISLTYEPKEDKLMQRPPRNVLTHKLFNSQVIMYSYLQAACIECTFCLLAYCHVFWKKGISIGEIVNTSGYWQQNSLPLKLNHQVYLAADQVQLQQEAATSYYVTLIMCQFVHLWVCRTRTTSLFKHGLFSNVLAILGAVIEVLLLSFFVYTPHVSTIFSSYPVTYTSWLFWIPAGLIFISTSELRKYYAREYPHGKNKYFNF